VEVHWFALDDDLPGLARPLFLGREKNGGDDETRTRDLCRDS